MEARSVTECDIFVVNTLVGFEKIPAKKKYAVRSKEKDVREVKIIFRMFKHPECDVLR
jgi:hypothetical protein